MRKEQPVKYFVEISTTENFPFQRISETYEVPKGELENAITMFREYVRLESEDARNSGVINFNFLPVDIHLRQ